MFARLALSAALALGVALPAAAFDLSEMTDDERSVFRSEIRAYLLENPEVLMEAISVLESREREAQAANDVALAQTYADQLFDDGHSWVGGNPDGDVTIVEFLDYRCGYCKRAFEEVETLLESDGNIRFIVKEFPILGDQSTLAARFAIAVLRVEGDAAYEDVHNTLMTMRSDVTMSALVQISDTFGLDTAAISAEMESEDVSRIIAENRALAQALAISGTPTFVIGDRLVRGYIPGDQMELVVAEARAQD
ncbi:thioredoxin domain-containing protein [Ponticoccus sp. SC2-23]|uniref:DsbA family protein n=1 Tax=Alexandriicola marinus TaxID=2081710 RepID=UPI000FD969F5|nr:DsbA family protein [Alexandriicola marinus]MBM1219312.1 thioredoxin domain-containing protein [Ponticoccus sp. SC6-9]MBM1223616.1 thioredoxin domain-containing protein [Ponticoccus sp. SC6-15]MBM1229125.1 thioredoxin domain-containing protein [Ponticoccus sp. SC6-38]MBM1232582.1 thioredoxin domain-containing protein [Ponticoccus sp. SC6-45]MBM1237468.1 thioredoxin domain-containing protein [Ponticoccus sp. SC6-49]MBM1241593.1 thioredoxin domain-containing protein [Ponticoccus sp. SC2-64]